MNIISITDSNKKKVVDFFKNNWGSPLMITSNGVFNCGELEGFIIFDKNENIIGLITYIINENYCEIISLDSLEEGKGIGGKLISKLEEYAKSKQCHLVKLITTNDNLNALKFYQKRGYILNKIIKNAVEEARKVKPEIPLLGYHGIPIKDELELIKVIS